METIIVIKIKTHDGSEPIIEIESAGPKAHDINYAKIAESLANLSFK
jgi:hypothetical protein